MSSLFRSRVSARLIGPLLLVPAIAAATAACTTTGTTTGTMTGTVDPAATGSVASESAPADGDWRHEVQAAGDLYKANPGNGAIAMRYARALRAIGQRAQAAAVLEQVSIRDPKNRAVLGAYGRALADTGNYAQALEVLNRAHTPDQPDWRILSVQGAVLDQMGRHEEARRYYASALRLAPDEPSVLSNLGLSYALSKDLKQAEATLRRATSGGRIDPRVRQNLALVVGLQGRFAEAETIARADLPPDEAAANVTYLRQMLAHPNGLARLPHPGTS
jgi:Flp pilus assembly protein TadD